MKFLICFGFILHILFLISIFYIYFQSPILTNLTPQPELPDPPAKRLVLIVADGLRAESIYEKHFDKVPFLAEIVLRRGSSGVSHTRVPTESRPGHVALIAGLYEDPSAIFKGWKENPVEFDHVFNRSHLTFGWGSPDIVPIFARGVKDGHVRSFTYNPDDEDFSGQTETLLLDQWVFDRVKEFLEDENRFNMIKDKDRVILFLHLLGLDTAGHVHKPNSEKFIKNLILVDAGIRNITDLIQQKFQDNKTAFIFTADHGMTDRGSHGDGDHFETETPLIAWGAGINNWNQIDELPHNQLFIQLGTKLVPKFDTAQADIAPLMSSVLGIPPPVNNFGNLPHYYLNASSEYVAAALNSNAQQILQQYKRLYEQSQRKMFQFFISDEEYRIENRVAKMEYLLKKAYIDDKKYEDVPDITNTLLYEANNAIEYYQQYYKWELLFSLSTSMAGWIYILVQQLYVKTDPMRRGGSKQVIIIITLFIVLCLVLFNYVQNTPSMVTLYFILPVITWYFVYNRRNLARYPSSSRIHLVVATIILMVTTELMILAFFHRKILSAILIGHCLYELSISEQNWNSRIKLLLSTLALAVFPSLPIVQKDSKENIILYLGIISWIIKHWIDFKNSRTKSSLVQLLIFTTAVCNLVYIVYCLDNQLGAPTVCQLLCWVLTMISFLTPLFGPLSIRQRISAIENALAIPVVLMSLSYEPLFLLALVINVKYWIQSELALHQEQGETLDSLTFGLDKSPFQLRFVNLGDVRRVTKFVLYLLISMFGTGNVASISSFDPNWVRCFISTFSPFIMTALIIIKLVMPVLYLACSLKALNVITKIQTQKLLIIILIICDVMCINFLYLVKNRGSWLDIGTSISHFIIMESTVLVISILYGIGHVMTTFSINKRHTNDYSNLPVIAKISLD